MFGILRRIFRKREKPRVFLGTLVVVPRADIKRHFDQRTLSHEELETPLQANLREIFSLPSASEVSDPLPTDLGLDVFIPSFQSGEALAFSLADLGVPVFWIFLWRPKVTVTCRLYSLKSQETKYVYSVTKKLPWREYVSRLFSLQAFFRFRPIFSAEDLNQLLNLACHSLLNKLTKVT